ncbi:MAG: IPT/TIG domain-containing protein, partial [Candidatus Sericytochromatia bacterium]
SGTHTFSNTTTSITSLSAATGAIGTSLTINGGGFDTTPGNNTVKFGNVEATVTEASATSLTVTVPEMTAGTYNVTVSVGGSTNGGTNNFGVQPSVTGLSGSSGVVGSSVTISGIGFDPTLTTNNTVKFGTTTATVTFASSTSLTVTVPATGNSKNVSVTVGGQTSTDTATYEVIPTISNLSSFTGFVGNTITVTGTGFDTSAMANNVVKFGNTTATVTGVTSTTLTVSVAGIAGPQNVTVTVGNHTSTETFTYTIKLTVGSFSPTSGNIGTTTVTVNGTGFDYLTPSNNSVLFRLSSAGSGGTPATVTSASPNQLKVTVPDNIFSAQKIFVTVGGQNANTSTNFNVKPFIESLSPSSGNTGNSITITGTGFDPTSTTFNTVRFVGNGTTITVTAVTNTTVTFTVPSVAAGNYNVTVQTGSQTSASSPFTHN